MEEPVSESRQRRRARERKQRKGGAAASGAALTLGVALAASPAAQAATFNVTNLDDAGAGSLRQAIEDANGAAGADTITFDPGLNGGAIILSSGQLSITDSVDIQGPGAANLAVTANDTSRVFYLYNGAASLDVTISGLTITGGNADIGGGIVNFDENLTLDGVTLTGNSASVDGGGLWADGFSMNLTIRDSVITGNAASDDGGGLYVEDTGGPLLIQNTVISGNQANDKGGGIYFYDPDDSITIDNSTISGNTAGSLGGGIYLYDTDGGEFAIQGSTLSGNDASAGGGLFLYGPDDPVLIQNSTISGNQATAGNGGGIYFYSLYGATLEHTTVANNSANGSGGGTFLLNSELAITNSIVADNTAATDNDLSTGVEATFNTSFSLIESPGAATINDNGGTILNQDPQLGPLQNNGGTTLTQRPTPTSPAVNTGDPAFTTPPATDQRGANRIQNGRTDMGAVEVGASGTIQLTVTTTSVNENGGTVTITATRTGGSDGAVSVTFSTSNGTAQSPGDYTGTVGTLSWADGDTAPKTFNVAIIDDAATEPSETFNVILSNPQGGATLGAAVTEVVTIVDNDAAVAVPVPTVGEYGLMLLTALFGLGGVLMIRRKKGLAAPVLVVSMTLGAAAAGVPAAEAAKPSRAETRVTTVARIQAVGEEIVIRLSDGTTYRIGEKSFQLIDGRKGRGRHGTTPDLRSIQAGQPVFLKVRHDATGKVKRVRLELADSAADAQARLQAQRD